MPTFPTLDTEIYYPLEEEREDSTIRSKFEDGYEHTRPRYTKIRYTWNVNYRMMPGSDKDTLEAFVTTVREGADSFSWTNPQSGATYTVKFSQIPKYSCTYKINSISYFEVHFQLRTV